MTLTTPSHRVTQAEFARIMGVNKSTVHKWIKAGRMGLTADNRVDVATARQQLTLTESDEPRHQAMKAAFDAQRAAQRSEEAKAVSMQQEIGLSAPSGPYNDAESMAYKIKQATLKRITAEAELKALDVDRKAGLLVERAEVDYLLADFAHTLNAKLSGLADRYAASIAQHRGDVNRIHQEIDDAVFDLLEELADHLQRKQTEIFDATGETPS